jgi:multidrug transporter EmrE-like cation transporter
MKIQNHSLPESVVGFAFILGSILFTVYGQLVVKWQVGKAGSLPETLSDRVLFLARLVMNPWVLSAMAAGFGALLCWLAAMTKFELSYAYPFMSLAFVLVLILSVFFFGEGLTAPKVLGVLVVIVGIAIASRG